MLNRAAQFEEHTGSAGENYAHRKNGLYRWRCRRHSAWSITAVDKKRTANATTPLLTELRTFTEVFGASRDYVEPVEDKN